ncbi:MAG: phosphopantothenate--cysteine ligase family flavoprotein [Phycisphaeraceae bacterium]|nr:phosphopantothenate--cysteine ligase family flavoprotein [Phycisphaeraceae bacterium]
MSRSEPTIPLSRPTPSDLGDREVVREGDELEGVRAALLVTGSIAAFKTPIVARLLRKHGARVTPFASQEALRYVTAEALSWSCDTPAVTVLSPESEHLSDAAPFEVYLVAPATANTLAKMAAGIADGVVTATLASALGRVEQGRASLLVAPAMHGSMHTAILDRNLRTLVELGVEVVPPRDAAGKHNLPDEQELLRAVIASVRRRAAAVRAARATPGV